MGIICKINHQLLILLHVSEGIFIHNVRVMEEKVILRCNLDFDVLDAIMVALL